MKEQNRQCTKCKGNKPLSDFSRQAAGRDGYQSWCQKCVNYVRTNKDRGLYRVYWGINTRCNYSGGKNSKYYFDKGIKNDWKTYAEFKNDMYESYCNHLDRHGKRDTVIDRIDSSKNYSKENCRWLTYKENRANNTDKDKGKRIFYEYKGEKKTVEEWAKIYHLDRTTLASRIRRYGWSMEEALNTKPSLGNKHRHHKKYESK